MLEPQTIVNQRYQLERQLDQNTGRETWLAKDIDKENELVVVNFLAFGGNVQWEDLKLFEREANVLKQLLIKPTTKRVAGRSPAIGFIFLFVADLKANCCETQYAVVKVRAF